MRERGERRWRTSFTPALLALAVYAGWTLMHPRGSLAMAGVAYLAMMLTAGAAALACARARHRATGDTRRVWLLIGLGCVGWLSGCAVNLWAVHGGRAVMPCPSLADVGFLAFPLCAAAGLLQSRRLDGGLAQRARLFTDSIIAAWALLTIVWQPVVAPVLYRSSASPLARSIALAYPVTDLALLALVIAVLAQNGPRTRLTMTLSVSGLVSFAASDIAFAVETQQNGFDPAGPETIGWVAAFVLIGLAALHSRYVAPPASSRRTPRPTLTYLPYLPLVAVSGLGVYQVVTGADIDPVMMASTLVLLGLCAIRHALATRENSELTKHLERRVDERTAELAHLAFHDPLTGLPNRARLIEVVDDLLAAPRTGPIWLLLLDIDGFKSVNDTLGPSTGDALLRAVADRLTAVCREEDLLVRLGGDEFAVLLIGSGQIAAVNAARRIISVFGTAFSLPRQHARLGASIGLASADDEITAASDLLRDADLAMYAAKGAGRGQAVMFVPDMRSAAAQRAQLEADLHDAVAARGLSVAYQPIINLLTGECVGAEALMRWRHPERGDISPADFIPIAEQSDLILDMGRWVLRAACRQAAQWRAELPMGRGFEVAVNLSVRQLQHPSLVRDVQTALAESGLPADHLVVEITESVFLDTSGVGITALYALRGMGVRIALDDFGTGYSSLSYLERFAVDILKVDRQFVAGLTAPGGRTAVTSAIVALAHSLDLAVIAEGIENEAQVAFLRGLGCGLGQGFLLARPGPPGDVARLLATQRPVVAPISDDVATI